MWHNHSKHSALATNLFFCRLTNPFFFLRFLCSSLLFFTSRGAVLALALNSEGDFCFSGGMDGTIRIWHLPEAGSDPSEPYEPAQENVLMVHDGAIVALACITDHLLLAASAAGTCSIWDTTDSSCTAEWRGPAGAKVTALKVRQRGRGKGKRKEEEGEGGWKKRLWGLAVARSCFAICLFLCFRPPAVLFSPVFSSFSCLVTSQIMGQGSERAVVGYDNGTARVYDVNSGEVIYTLGTLGNARHYTLYRHATRSLLSSCGHRHLILLRLVPLLVEIHVVPTCPYQCHLFSRAHRPVIVLVLLCAHRHVI